LGIDALVDHGGIVSRGILLDYPAYRARHGLAPADPFASASISLAELQEMTAEAGVTPRPGDVLLVRVGFTPAYEAISEPERVVIAQRPQPDFLGVEPSLGVLRWIWESGFAAVGGDAPSFERAPIAGPHTEVGGVWKGEPWEEEMQTGGLLHQWLLGGWGLPIGELFDLEKLANMCAEKKRWTFFVSSMPLKVSLGVCLASWFGAWLRITDTALCLGSWGCR
jgi:hypothetical protein